MNTTRRVRINFGAGFCGVESCNICFADANDKRAKAREIEEEGYRTIATFQSAKKSKADKLAKYAAIVDKQIEAKKQEKKALADYKCPSCNGPMAARTNRYTNGRFLGCRAFPNCKGTRNVDWQDFQIPSAVTPTVVIEQPIPAPIVIVEPKPVIVDKPTKSVDWRNPFQKKPIPAPLTEVIPVPLAELAEVTFDSLLNRPIRRVEITEDAIKLDGKVAFAEIVHAENEQKTDKERGK